MLSLFISAWLIEAGPLAFIETVMASGKIIIQKLGICSLFELVAHLSPLKFHLLKYDQVNSLSTGKKQ